MALVVTLCDGSERQLPSHVRAGTEAEAVCAALGDMLQLQDWSSFGLFQVVMIDEERKSGLFRTKKITTISAESLIPPHEPVNPTGKLVFKKMIHRPGEALERRPDKTHIHMLYMQAVRGVVRGDTPATLEIAVKLASAHCHALGTEVSSRGVRALLPPHLAEKTADTEWERKVRQELKSAHLTQLSREEAEWKCLQIAERLPLYGTESFGANKARVDASRKLPAVLGIALGAAGVVLYDEKSRTPVVSFSFDMIVDHMINKSTTKPDKLDWVVNVQHTATSELAHYVIEVPRVSEVHGLVELYRERGGRARGVLSNPNTEQMVSPQPALSPSSLDELSDEGYDWANDEDLSLSELTEDEELSPSQAATLQVSSLRSEYWGLSHQLSYSRVLQWQQHCTRGQSSGPPEDSLHHPEYTELQALVQQCAHQLRERAAAPLAAPETQERVQLPRGLVALRELLSALRCSGEPAGWSMVAGASLAAGRQARLMWGWGCWVNEVAVHHAERQHGYQVESATRMRAEAVGEAAKALEVTRDVLEHKQKILARELVRLRKQEGGNSTAKSLSPPAVIMGI